MTNDYLIIVGNNYISDYLYNEYKRNGFFKVINTDNINTTNNIPHYIIDCSFDNNTQYDTFKYCNKNNINKLLLINHWCVKIPTMKTIVIQAIVYDIYGNEHYSFNRPSAENNYDEIIKYCSLISESIRRIHDSKINMLPITYIPYEEKEIKFLNIEKLYNPINYLFTFNKNSVFSIYEDIKTIDNIVQNIKTVLDYNGNVYVECDESKITKKIPRLDYNYKQTNLSLDIKKIYHYLLNCNDRFFKN